MDVVQQDRFIGVVATTAMGGCPCRRTRHRYHRHLDRRTGADPAGGPAHRAARSGQPVRHGGRAGRRRRPAVRRGRHRTSPPSTSRRSRCTAPWAPPPRVADVRSAPDPATGIQATIWSGTQNVTALRGAIAGLLGLPTAAVRVIYEEASGCYGHDGVDDCAADAALLSQAVGAPVRVQWTRQDEHGWEPYGGAQAHDMKAAVGKNGITAWSHLIYAPTANSRPSAGNPGTLLAGALTGLLPDPLPATSVDTSGRNAPVTYDFPQRVEARLIKSFETTGPSVCRPRRPAHLPHPPHHRPAFARRLLQQLRQRVVLRRTRPRRRPRPAATCASTP